MRAALIIGVRERRKCSGKMIFMAFESSEFTNISIRYSFDREGKVVMVRNFLDVEAVANRLSAEALMRTGGLSRSGAIGSIVELASVGNQETTVCLRRQAGHFEDAVRCIPVPACNRVENDQTERKSFNTARPESTKPAWSFPRCSS